MSCHLKLYSQLMQVQILVLFDVRLKTASLYHLAEALCSMPNLTDLTLITDYEDDDNGNQFYSTLEAMASSLQVCVY